jgi:hypothetical protein
MTVVVLRPETHGLHAFVFPDAVAAYVFTQSFPECHVISSTVGKSGGDMIDRVLEGIQPDEHQD